MPPSSCRTRTATARARRSRTCASPTTSRWPSTCATGSWPTSAPSRASRACRSIRMVPGWDFMRAGDGATSHVEWFRSSVGQVSLTWKDLGDVYIVEMPKDKSATGQHEMFSLFVDVRGVRGLHQRQGRGGQAVPARVRRQEGQQHGVPGVLGDLGEGVGTRHEARGSRVRIRPRASCLFPESAQSKCVEPVHCRSSRRRSCGK